MAHFAKIEDGVVVAVYVIANDEMVDEDGVEQESLGIARCNELMGEANWVQTSYNKKFRKLYAGIDYTYDTEKDKFIKPQPYPSWVLDENDDWQAPVAPEPIEDQDYFNDRWLRKWDEENLQWVDVKRPQPYSTWIEVDNRWVPPVAYPDDGKVYMYDDASSMWVLIE